MFITFEGVEGCGKTTQIKMLDEALRELGRPVLKTREPGGPAISEQVRQILLDANNSEMQPVCELLLYYAARSQHLEQTIKPHLQKGDIVLCDRFVDSTIAYQGYARGLSLKDLAWLTNFVLKDFKIDLTLLFDLPVEIGLERANKRAALLAVDQREDRFEKEALKFHQAVRDGFLSLAKSDSKRYVVLDATLSIDDLHDQIINIVKDKLNEQ